MSIRTKEVVVTTTAVEEVVSDFNGEHGQVITSGGWELRDGVVNGGELKVTPTRIRHAQHASTIFRHLLKNYPTQCNRVLADEGWVRR
jgi:hypothetical protein